MQPLISHRLHGKCCLPLCVSIPLLLFYHGSPWSTFWVFLAYDFMILQGAEQATHVVSEQKRPAYCHLMLRMAWGNPDWLQKAQVTSMHALRPLLVTLKRPRTILQAALWWLVVGRFYWWCSGFWPHWCNTLVMVVQSYWEVHSYNNGTHF